MSHERFTSIVGIPPLLLEYTDNNLVLSIDTNTALAKLFPE
jgi:hypothetical protein